MAEQPDIWRVFWKRYQERYPFAFVFENAIATRVKQMWTDVSPTYEMPLNASWTLEQGEFKANMLGFLILGATGEVVFENLTKYLVSPEVMKTI